MRKTWKRGGIWRPFSPHPEGLGRTARWQPQERKQGAHCDGNTDQGVGAGGVRLLLRSVFATEKLTVRTRRVDEGR